MLVDTPPLLQKLLFPLLIRSERKFLNSIAPIVCVLFIKGSKFYERIQFGNHKCNVPLMWANWVSLDSQSGADNAFGKNVGDHPM